MAAAADAGRHFPTHDEQLRLRFAASQSPTSSLNADAPPASSAETKTGVSLAGLTASFSSALSASLGGGVPAAASMMIDEPVGDSLVTPNPPKLHPQIPASSTTSPSPFQQSTAPGKSDFASVVHEAPTAPSSATVGAAAPMPKSGGRLESSQGLAKYTAGVMTLDALTTPLPLPPNAEPDFPMVTSTAPPKTGPMPPVNVHHGRSLLFKPQDQRQDAPMAAAGGTRHLHPAQQEKDVMSQQTRRTTATPAARFDARYLEERGAPPPHQAAASAVAAVGWWRGATAALFSDGDASAVDVVSATHGARDGRAGFNGVGSASQFTATRASSGSSSFSASATDRPYAAEAARARQHAAGLPLAADGDGAPRVAVAGPGGSAIRSTRTARLATMNTEAQRTANGVSPANATHSQSATSTAGRDSAPRPAVTQSRPKGKSYVAPSSPFLLLNEEDLHDADPTVTLPPRATTAQVHPSITPPEIIDSRTTTTSTGAGSTGIGRSGDAGGGAGFLRGASTTTQQTVMLHAMDRLAVEAEQTFQPALAPANPVRDLATSLSEKATAASESVRSRLQEFSQPPRPISAPGGPMVVTVPVGSASSSSSSNAQAVASSLPKTTAAAAGGAQAAVPPQQNASSDMAVKSSVKPSANGATSKRQRRVAFNIPEHVSNALEAGVFEQRSGDAKGRPTSTASGAPAPAPSLPHAAPRPGMLRSVPLSAAAVAAPSGDVSSTVFAMRLGSTFDALAPSGSANSTSRIPSTTPGAVTMPVPAVTAARPVGVRKGGWDLPLLFTQRHNEQRDATAALAMTTAKETTVANAAGALTVVPSAVALVAPHRPAALPYIVAPSTAHRDSAEAQAKSAEAAVIIAEAQDRPRPRWERAMFASVASSLDAIHAARATDDAVDPAIAETLPSSGGPTKVAVPPLPFATNAAASFVPARDDDEDTVGASPFAPAPEISDTLPFEERTRLQFPESIGFEDDSRAPASVIVSHTRRELRRTAPASTAHESTTPRSVVLHEFSEEEGDVAPLYTPFAVPLPSAGLVDKIIFGRDANATPGRSAAISRSASVAQTPWMSAAPTPRHARAALRSADGRFPDTASMYGGPSSAERNDKPSPGSLLTDVLRDVRGAKKDIRGLRPLPADAVAKLAAMEGHGKHTPCLKTDVKSAEVHAVMLLDHWRFAARQYGSSPLSAAALANLEARFGSPALLSSPAMTHAASVRDDHQLLRGHRDRILCHAAEMDMMMSRQHSFGGPGACGFKFDYDTDDDDGASSVHPLSLSTMERHHRMPALISTPPQSGRGAEFLYDNTAAALDGGASTTEFPFAPLPAASKDFAFGSAPFAACASPVPFDGQLDQDAAFFFEEELSRAQEQAHLAYPVDDAVTHIGCACCDQPLSKFAARRVAAPPAVCCHATCLVRGEYILTHGGGTVKGACSTFRVLHVPTRQWFAPRVACVDEAGFVFGTGLQYSDAAANSTTRQEQQHQSQSQDGNLVFPDLTLFGHSAVAVCQGNWAIIIGGRPSPLGEEEEPTPEITMPDTSAQNQNQVPSSEGATSATSEAAAGAAGAQGHAAAVEAASRSIALFAVDLRALVERMEIVVHRLPQDPGAATDCDDAGWGLPSSSELEDAQLTEDAHEGVDVFSAARDVSQQEGIHSSSAEGRTSASEASSRSPSVASVWSAHSARGRSVPGPRSLHTATLVSRLDDPHTARIAVLMGLGRALECLPDAWCLMLRSNTFNGAGADAATSVRSDHHEGEKPPSRSERRPPFTVRWLPLPLALPPHLEGGVGGHSAVLSQQRPGDRGVKRLFLFGGRRNDGGFVPGCHVYDPMMGLLAPLPQQTLQDATAAANDRSEGNPSRTGAQLHNGTGVDGRELSTGGDFFNAAFSPSVYSSSSQASSTPRRLNGVGNGEPEIEGPMFGPAAGACMFPQGRYAHAAWPDGQGGFFIHGGDREGTYFSDVWRFHGGPMAWECLDGEGTTPLSGLAPRSGHGAVVHHGAVYLLGGEAVVSMDDPPSDPQRPTPSTTTNTGSTFLDAPAPVQPAQLTTGGGTTVAAPAASHEDAASLSSGPFPPSTTASTGLPPPSIVATGTPVHFDAGGLFPHVPSSSTMSPVLHRSGEEFLRSPNIPGVGSWDDAGHPVTDPAHHHHHHSNNSFPRSVASPTQPDQAHLPHPHAVQPQQPQEQQSHERRSGQQPSGGQQEQMSRSRLASVDTTEYRDMHFTVPASGSDDFYEGGEASPTTADGFDPPSAHPAGQASDHAGQISSGSGSSEAVPGAAQASSLPSGAHEEARGVTVRLRYFRATPEWHFRPFDAQRSLKALCCAWLMHAEQADDSDFGL